jgi:hypothetical protein
MNDKNALRRFYLDSVYGRTAFDPESAATYGFGGQAFREIRAKCIPKETPACRYCGRDVGSAPRLGPGFGLCLW